MGKKEEGEGRRKRLEKRSVKRSKSAAEIGTFRRGFGWVFTALGKEARAAGASANLPRQHGSFGWDGENRRRIQPRASPRSLSTRPALPTSSALAPHSWRLADLLKPPSLQLQ